MYLTYRLNKPDTGRLAVETPNYNTTRGGNMKHIKKVGAMSSEQVDLFIEDYLEGLNGAVILVATSSTTTLTALYNNIETRASERVCTYLDDGECIGVKAFLLNSDFVEVIHLDEFFEGVHEILRSRED